ncbi:Rev interacting protein Rip-1-like protein [Guillardia theta]|uniref:KRR-R motif-containing protein 1 n=1 Tax=Guillardia theta TaxID=55529 RepID=Q9AW78_GUITH|nr:Rev interacting protein Rip-1-like protein [Guillardia theta]CAC26992.1 Rev interacting protein Rip-1-like protein [Guillardia theta]|mmetsp:Transcript_37431/g.117981  ORF Transcript_37431/g.117981 Transcript_37431/m.117981 type:complete len:263 (-) Transcript_37431:2783-3571(-)
MNLILSNAMNKFKKSFDGINITNLIEVSCFKIKFPKYQENYIKENWHIINRIMKIRSIVVTINVNLGLVEIMNSLKGFDPYSIIKAKDFITLVCRGVPIFQASKIFKDDIFCEIIKISKFTSSRQSFLKKRKRLIGNNGVTVKTIELLTKCYILIQGNTVACMGKFRDLKWCINIITKSMTNNHPIFYLKNIQIKKKLMNDEFFKTKNWDKYLLFEKKNTLFNLESKKKELKFNDSVNIENFGNYNLFKFLDKNRLKLIDKI